MKFKFYITAALAITLLASGCTQNSTPQSQSNPTGASVSGVNSDLSQTYTNTKYKYNFQYPSTYHVESSLDSGGSPTPAAEDSQEVDLYTTDATQPVIMIGADIGMNPNFSQTGVENSLGDMAKNATISPIEIFGVQGFKAIPNGNNKSLHGEEYFVENQGMIYHIGINQPDTTTQQILDSFKFTK
jgi:hypothetical protein